MAPLGPPQRDDMQGQRLMHTAGSRPRGGALLQLRHWGLALAASLLLGACSEQPPREPVAGSVVKGLVEGASVEVYRMDDFGQPQGEPIASGSTGPQGRFTLSELPEGGPFLLRAFGGSYIDEADQTGTRRISFGPNEGLETLLPAGVNTVAITPYSNALLAKIRNEAAADGTFFARVDGVRALFAEAFEFDVLTTTPTDPQNPTAGGAARSYALMLGGAATWLHAVANELGFAQQTPALIALLVQDLTDGALDTALRGQPLNYPGAPEGFTLPDLNGAIERFRNNNDPRYTGVSAPEILSLIHI